MKQLQQVQPVSIDEILSTKLTVPRLQASLITRESLLSRLDEGLERKLTLLSAPPGFGKTTLVCQWVASRGEDSAGPPVAWVTLDSGDNDPVRFWRYLITACQAFDPAIGQSGLTLLRTPQKLSFEAVLTTFINDLAQLPNQGILVLEDYHLITSVQIHELMTFFLDHLPPTLHLMITTRSDPSLPLARLRARNNLNELGAADLRFSLVEVQAFLQQAGASSLSLEAVTRLTDRTEGWIAGLRLVALALQRRQTPQAVEQFLFTFNGSHRHILEYLVEEALQAQPEPLQEFLLQTSFLNRLNGSLCDALTDRNDSVFILEQFERANLFLIPLDGAQQWYRYHTLFAEAMQHYARHRFGDKYLCELFCKASLWYETHGHLVEAVEAALAAQAFERAATLIEQQIIALQLAGNEYHTLRRWIAQIPEATLQPHPALCFIYAIAILFTSDRQARTTVELLQKPLAIAEQAWQAEGDRAKLGAVFTVHALVEWLQGDAPGSFASARQALTFLPEDDFQWRGISLIFTGAEELLAGQLKTARQTFTQALALCKTAGNMYGTLDTIVLLGQVSAGQGELRQAAQFYHQALSEVEHAPMDKKQILLRQGRSLAGLGILHWERNKLEDAHQQAAQALEIARQIADEDLLVRSSLLLAMILQAQGEADAARQVLHPLGTQVKRPLLLRKVQTAQARLALAVQDLASVQRWEATYARSNENVPCLQHEGEVLLMARLQISQGQAEAALSLLAAWQAEAHQQGRARSELEIILLKALAYSAYNQPIRAKQLLIRALTLAQPENYQRLFLDEGQKLASLLQATLPEINEEPVLTYTHTLLTHFTNPELEDKKIKNLKSSEKKPPYGEIQTLIEPLSPQEERVLHLLASGLSNPEIARELIVSINTVKTQVQTIYRKLDVHSRREARDTAQRLNLL